MKRTTYIIIGLLALLPVAAFFFPVAFFKESQATIITAGTKTVHQAPGNFSEIHIRCPRDIRPDAGPDAGPLRVIISTDSSLNAPVIAMNETWARNITVGNSDGSLTIDIDMHSFADSDSDAIFRLSAGSEIAATISVPRQALSAISADYCAVTLIGLSQSRPLSLSGEPVEIRDSRIDTLRIAESPSRITLHGGSIVDLAESNAAYLSVATDSMSMIKRLSLTLSGNANEISLSSASLGSIDYHLASDTTFAHLALGPAISIGPAK